jgi:hypothetical protein
MEKSPQTETALKGADLAGGGRKKFRKYNTKKKSVRLGGLGFDNWPGWGAGLEGGRFSPVPDSPDNSGPDDRLRTIKKQGRLGGPGFCSGPGWPV